MTYSANGNKRSRTGARTAAWIALPVAGVLLVYAFWQSSDKGIPGWQPVNSSLMAALSTPAALEQGPAVQPSPSVTNKHGFSARSFEPASSASASASASAAPSKSPATLNLNAATAADLDGLPGIGPAKAKTIIAYRDNHHGFRSVEELLHVNGIGPKMLDKIRPHVFVGKSGTGS